MKKISNFAFFYVQEYEEAMKKLREAYFSNITDVDTIKRINGDLLSEYYENIKIVSLQATANHKPTGRVERRNTFLFR